MKRVATSLLLIACLLSVAFGQTSPNPTWKVVAQANGRIFSINTKRITHPFDDDGIVRVWRKMELQDNSPEGRLRFKRELSPDDQKLPFEDFSHSLSLEDYNCRTQKQRLIKHLSFGLNDRVIQSYEFTKVEWFDVLPGSTDEKMLLVLCGQNQW